MAINGVTILLSALLLITLLATPAAARIFVTSIDIVDRSIQAVDIATGAIKTWKLGDGAVTSSKIRDGGVRRADIENAAINKEHIATGAVNSYKILDRSVKTEDIATGAIKAWKLSDGAVTSAKILDAGVRSVDIAKAAIYKEHIATGAINTYKILDGSIKNIDIAASAGISASKINSVGLDADTLDGKHASAFATSGHDHDSAYSALAHNHDLSYASLNHSHDSSYSASGHDHDADYYTKDEAHFNHYTKSQSDTNFAASDHSHDTTVTTHLSISATGVLPRIEWADKAERLLGEIWSSGSSSTNPHFEVPVALPHGAVVTKFQYVARDNSGAATSNAWLYRSDTENVLTEMATVSTTDSASWQVFEDNTIVSPTIDNSQNAYFIAVNLNEAAGSDLKAGKFIVTYSYSNP